MGAPDISILFLPEWISCPRATLGATCWGGWNHRSGEAWVSESSLGIEPPDLTKNIHVRLWCEETNFYLLNHWNIRCISTIVSFINTRSLPHCKQWSNKRMYSCRNFGYEPSYHSCDAYIKFMFCSVALNYLEVEKDPSTFVGDWSYKIA